MKTHHTRMVAVALWACAASVMAADIVVIGHPSAATMTKEQVSDLFLGKSQSLAPMDLPDSSATRVDFYKHATGRDLAQTKALWARLVFSGKAQPPKELADSAAVRKAVAADPKAVGYIEKSALDGSVKVLLAVD